MKRSYILFLIFVLSILTANAQTVSESTAHSRAEAFFATQAANAPGRGNSAPSASLTLAYTSVKDDHTCFYVYNRGENDGFVIIGGDAVANEILAYVPQGHFNYDSIPDNVKWWLGEYEKEISTAKKLAPQSQKRNAAAPKRATQSSTTTDVRNLFMDIPDLITSKWDQGWPYNAAIPMNGGDTERPVTGCVATAMAQIMNYWKWPITGEGSMEFSFPFNNQTSSADFGNTIYDWENMLDTYSQEGSYTQTQIDAISTLMYHVGVADRMMYYSGGAIGTGDELVNALPQYFRYSDRITLLRRGDYLDDEWEEIIYSEIQAGRPVYLEGGGHAFVLHGYTTSQNMFSVNFGWSGNFDGYYQITATRQYFYDDSNYIGDEQPMQIIIHIEPDTISHQDSFSNVGDTIAVDGIRYDLIGPLSKTVEVTYGPNEEIIYSGEVTIPESITYNNEVYTVTKIGRFGLAEASWLDLWHNFQPRSSITSLHLPNTLRSIARAGLAGTKISELSIPENVEMIADYAFQSMKELTTISLPSNVQYVANNCFEYCDKLDKVELPASIKAFGMNCFSDCSALSLLVLNSLEIPSVYMLDSETTFPMDGNYTPFPSGFSDNCVLAVPYDAIDDYKNDEVFGLWKTIIPIESIPADYGQIIDVDDVLYKIGFNELIVVGYNGDGTDVNLVIPSVVTHNNITYPVTIIADNAFYRKNFQTITIEEGIKKIGKHVFEDCISLVEIFLPNTLKEIGEFAFAYNYALRFIDIPQGVTDIGMLAFTGCTSITSIKIPNSIINLGSWIFSGCANLQQIQFPSSLKRIPGIAGGGCLHHLKSLVLPVLESLPFEGLGAIPGNAFEGLDSLNTMVCYAPNVPKTDYDNTPYFPERVSSGTLYVPAESVDAYRSAPGWQNWGTILPIVLIDSMHISDISIEKTASNTLSIEVYPLNATQRQIFYYSSNPEVATITYDGVITAIEIGETIITAETKDGKSATCVVTVTIPKFTITFVDEDGSVLQTSEVEYGQVPAYNGATPSKQSTAQYTYAFAGWSPEVVAVTGAATYTAMYSSTINSYLITFINYDGTTLQSGEVNYGVTPTYAGATPIKPATAQYTYTFKGWDKEVVSVVGAETYTAQFDSVVNKYTISFINEDGTMLQTSEVEYGQVPAYNGTTPTKAATAQYTYAFTGWTPEVVAVTSAATYTATYSSTTNSYLISFVNYDGTTLQSGEVNYGVTPVYIGEMPLKPATAQFTYTFKGWDKEIVSVVGVEVYTAQFDSVVNKYTITFVDEDGTTLQTSEVEYGKVPAYNSAMPTMAATAQYTYAFAGWTPEVVAVTGAATYTATYSSTINSYLITFVNYDGSTLQSGEVNYGVTPSYTSATPTKPATAQFTYTFKGWDKEIVSVVGAETYTAQFDSVVNKYTISFVNFDGTTLQTSEVEYGQVPAYNSATPSKAATAQYTYAFAGWTPEVVAVTGAATYTATYSSTINSYLITFVNYDGTTLQSGNVNFGVTPSYTGATPIKPATAQYTYTFKGWDKELVSVVGVETYTAQFDSVVNKCTITFVDEDGTTLQTSEVEYGQVPAYNSATPTKSATAQYTYTFSGWSPEVVAVTAAATYTATYSSTINQYTITVIGENCTISGEGTYNYGAEVTLTVTPDEGYQFVGWSDGVTEVTRQIVVTEDATYNAIVEVIETGLHDNTLSEKATKIYDGYNYYILRGGRRYTMQGQEVR